MFAYVFNRSKKWLIDTKTIVSLSEIAGLWKSRLEIRLTSFLCSLNLLTVKFLILIEQVCLFSGSLFLFLFLLLTNKNYGCNIRKPKLGTFPIWSRIVLINALTALHQDNTNDITEAEK